MATASSALPSQLPLRIEAVEKRFGSVQAVAGVSLDIEAGRCFGLLGPNGAGKSTLIRSIVGRVRPDAGQILIFGEKADSSAARARLGWVPQDLALYPMLSCRENLEAFGRYHGLRGEQLRDAINWCLDWAALTDRADAPVKTLSGGMKRRLNLAAGVIHRPGIVLLDEPTVGVDPQSRNRIFDMVENLREQSTTVIYTTHYMEEAERLCDRIAIIDHGKVIAIGTKEDLISRCFGNKTDVTIRLPLDAHSNSGTTEWVQSRAGKLADGVARFTIDRASDVAALLDSAVKAGVEVVDVTLRRPNLESVFLQLTGRELRQ